MHRVFNPNEVEIQGKGKRETMGVSLVGMQGSSSDA